MRVTRRGNKVADSEVIKGWLAEGCVLRVADLPPWDRRRGLAYVMNGKAIRLLTRHEAETLIGSGAVKITGGERWWNEYGLAGDKAGGGRGAPTPRATGENPV
ncbi:MAG: hypothetical protein WD407_05890 [Rhodospirillales bacterium]